MKWKFGNSPFFYKVLTGYFGLSPKKHWSAKLALALTLYLSSWEVQIFNIPQLRFPCISSGGWTKSSGYLSSYLWKTIVVGHRRQPAMQTGWHLPNHLVNQLPPNWDLWCIYSSSTSVIKDEKCNTDVSFSGEGVVLIVDPSVENELCWRKIRLNYTPVGSSIKWSCLPCAAITENHLEKNLAIRQSSKGHLIRAYNSCLFFNHWVITL